MSDIMTKVIYDCHCNQFCKESSYFITKCDNADNTFIYQGMHIGKFDEEEKIIGIFNPQEVKALKQILNNI